MEMEGREVRRMYGECREVKGKGKNGVRLGDKEGKRNLGSKGLELLTSSYITFSETRQFSQIIFHNSYMQH